VTSVLIVDDDDAFRTTIGRDLANQGFQVALAPNVEDAISTLGAQPIDVLLTDLRMPGEDGIDLLASVRTLSPRTRAILMSGFASARDYQRAIECGAVRVLCKPFTSSELLQAIRQAVDCETGFRGSIHGLSLVDLLQMFHYARRSLAIVVDSWAPGHVFLEDGRIIHAIYRGQSGEPALRAILAMPAGSLRTMVLPEGTPHSITRDFGTLILDSLRTLDEASPVVSTGGDWELDDFEDPSFKAAAPASRDRSSDAPAEDRARTRAFADRSPPSPPRSETCLELLRRLDGFTAACLVDSDTGVLLGSDNRLPGFDLSVAAAGYTEIYRRQRRTISDLALADCLEDVVVTLPRQYHVLHAIERQPSTFLYVIVERGHCNLGLVRYALAAAEAALHA
jgi:CheY-like chemotaxis protein